MSEEIKIPKHWKVKKLGEVCDVLDNLRKPINSTERQQRIAGKSQSALFPYYGATGQVGWIDGFLTDGEFILIGEDGAPFLDIYKDKAYKIKGKSWVNNHAHILKGKVQFLIDDFALYYLNSINYREFVNGTTRLKLTKSNLVEIPFVVPPLPEQQAIVSKIEELFSELDNGKQQLKTAQQQLQVYRQSLLKWAFEGKLTRLNDDSSDLYDEHDLKGSENNQGNHNNQKNHSSDKGELPKGWKWVKSGELFSFVTSGSRGWAKYYSNSGAIFIRITNMNFDTLELDLRESKIQYVNPPSNSEGIRTKVQEGDFLFSITGYLGMFAIAPKMENAFVNQHVCLCRPKDGFNKKYVGYWIVAKSGGIHHLNKNQKGAVKAGLNLDDLKTFPVPLCSLKEQQLIVSELESKLTVCDKIGETISNSLLQAETLRQSILKKAFEGKLVKMKH